GIVGAGIPDASATRHPRIARPRVVAWLARTRNGVGAPHFLTGLYIECRDDASDTHVTAGRSDDDLVPDHERRMRDRVALCRTGDHGVPDEPSALGIDGKQMGVD